jgi:hypothetical protein
MFRLVAGRMLVRGMELRVLLLLVMGTFLITMVQPQRRLDRQQPQVLK